MIHTEPFPERGPLRKDVILPRIPSIGPRRKTDPKVLEIVRRIEQEKLREYLEERARRRAS